MVTNVFRIIPKIVFQCDIFYFIQVNATCLCVYTFHSRKGERINCVSMQFRKIVYQK